MPKQPFVWSQKPLQLQGLFCYCPSLGTVKACHKPRDHEVYTHAASPAILHLLANRSTVPSTMGMDRRMRKSSPDGTDKQDLIGVACSSPHLHQIPPPHVIQNSPSWQLVLFQALLPHEGTQLALQLPLGNALGSRPQHLTAQGLRGFVVTPMNQDGIVEVIAAGYREVPGIKLI